ncbi:MAG: PAS domain-containing protein [Deltaproteobacteria bacterium]|nr:PAS domain-containing protein [Deltaproteobacteria bacterium]
MTREAANPAAGRGILIVDDDEPNLLAIEATLLMQAPVATALVMGPQLVFERVNPHFARMVGRDDLLGRAYFDAFPHLVGTPVAEILDRAYRLGEPHVSEEQEIALDRDGHGQLEPCFFKFNLEPLRDAAGVVIGLVAVAVDVTEQVEARRALERLGAERAELLAREQASRSRAEASERQLRVWIDTMPTLAWTARADGWIDFYNRRWYAYTGKTPEEMEGWDWQSVHDPAELPHVMEAWQRSIATGEPFEMTFPLRGADGAYRWHLTRVEPLRDADGRVVRWFGTNTDVDARQREERALADALALEHRAQARLTTILDQMPVGVMIVDATGRMTYMNLVAREIFGGPITQTAGPEELDEVFKARHRDGQPYASGERPVVRALAGEVVRGEVVELERADGQRAVVRVNATPICDDDGQVIAAVAAYDDITDQERLRRATEAARRDAETANQAKDDFIAMLGHELRNPLAPISTALELMALRQTGGEKERTVIERQVAHLTQLVDDLLDISRITTGKIELRRVRCEVADIINRAIELTSPILESGAHELTVDVPPTGLAIDGDLLRLAQVVANLLSNAAKYSDPRTPIWVTARREDDQIAVRVRDRGIGMAPEMLPRVFDLFTQERQAIDRSRGGLGLGLAIVRSLVHLHGGTVTATSAGLGQGSELVLRFPPALQEHEPAAGDARRISSRRIVELPRRILLVDDNEDAALMLSEMLQALGHTIGIAHDGPSALRRAAELQPEVAILDIGLPVMDGYELGAALREAHATIRLVALTGYGDARDRARSEEAGFDAHLVKPVSLAHVEATLRSIHDRASASSAK